MSTESFPVLRWKRVSEDLSKSVGGSSFYSGSISRVDGYSLVRCLGWFSGSGALGVTNKLWLAVSPDNISWNYWYTSSAINSGSSPTSITVNSPARFVRPILENQSGSSLTGSCVVEGFFES